MTNRRTARPIKVFYSYSNRDRSRVIAVHDHLKSDLWRRYDVTGFGDWMLPPGKRLRKSLLQKLDRVDLVLVFVSPGYLRSEWCKEEKNRALERHKRIVPVILRDCAWQETELGSITVVPSSRKAVAKWRPWQRAFEEIAHDLELTLGEISTQLGRENFFNVQDLHSHSANIRAQVLERLRHRGWKELDSITLKRILALLRSEESHSVLVEAVKTVCHFLTDVNRRQIYRAFTNDLLARFPDTAALDLLESMGQDDEGTRIARTLLKSEAAAAAVKASALERLLALGQKPKAKFLISCLGSPHVPLYITAARALRTDSTEAYLALMLRELERGDENTKRGIKNFFACLEDGQRGIIWAAIHEKLLKQGCRSREELLEILCRSTRKEDLSLVLKSFAKAGPDLKQEFVLALTEQPDYLEELKDQMKEVENSEVWRIAARALAHNATDDPDYWEDVLRKKKQLTVDKIRLALSQHSVRW